MFGIIYKATTPSGKVYIGQTTRSLEKRIKFHIYSSRYKKYKACHLFQKAILAYGNENIKWEILEEVVSREELNQREIFWIDYYRCNAKKYWYKYGYNLTAGGKQRSHYRLSETHKKRIGDSNRGRVFTEKVRKSMGCKGGKPSWISGKTKESFSLEHQNAIIEAQRKRRESPNYIPPMLGKKRTEEQKKRISEATKLAMQRLKLQKEANIKI